MFRLPAVTVRLPALPALAERALLEAMPVNGVADVPSIESVPATWTATFPALPDPNVPLAISPFVMIVKSPALTVMFPAFFPPVRFVVAKIPVVVVRNPAPFI